MDITEDANTLVDRRWHRVGLAVLQVAFVIWCATTGGASSAYLAGLVSVYTWQTAMAAYLGFRWNRGNVEDMKP